MGDGGLDVLSVQAAVEAHAFRELLDATIRRLIENTAPGLG
jgi:hypothetical protein